MTAYITLGADIEDILMNSMVEKSQHHDFWKADQQRNDMLPAYLKHPEFSPSAPNTPERFAEKGSVLEYTRNHYFPDSRSLASFSAEMNLDLYRSSVLLLKGLWETFFACGFQGWRPGNNALRLLSDVLGDNGLNSFEEAKKKFKPDCHALYSALESQGNQASRSGFNRESLRLLIGEMVLNELYLKANDGGELQTFVKRHQEELRLLQAVHAAQRERFWQLKCDWLQAKMTIGEKLFDVENLRMENANITLRWLHIFGGEYLLLEKEHQRLLNFRCLLELKKLNPCISAEEIERIALERQKKSAEKLHKIQEQRLKVQMSSQLSGQYADEKQLAQIAEECKRTLRKIWLLTHPDRLCNNEVYNKLTDQQKLTLEAAFREACAIQNAELGCEPGR